MGAKVKMSAPIDVMVLKKGTYATALLNTGLVFKM